MELALAALAIHNNDRFKAIRLLRDECAWTLRYADSILRLIAPHLYANG